MAKREYRKDLTGQRFGRLTVIKEAEPLIIEKPTYRRRIRMWLCLCDCGNTCIVRQYCLTSGMTKSCGCLKSELSSKRRKKDLTGQRFGKLTVIKEAYTKNYQVYWECLCDCGNTCYVPTAYLTSGKVKSCGCLIKEVMGPKLYVDITGKKSGYLTVIAPTELRAYRQVLWLCNCELCGGETLVTTTDFLNEHTISCGCLKSKGEEKIGTILRKNGIRYKKGYKIDGLFIVSKKGRKTRLPFDFGILNETGELQYLIEFQGLQHFTPTSRNGFGDQQRLITDPMKREFCKTNNIKLYEIKYDEDIEKRMEEIMCVHANPVGNASA